MVEAIGTGENTGVNGTKERKNIMEIVKIENVELTKEEAEKICKEEKYIVTYSKIYQLNYNTVLAGYRIK